MTREDLYLCTTCRRHFDIGPVMLRLAAQSRADWEAPIHCPRCDAITIQQAKGIIISPQPSGIN